MFWFKKDGLGLGSGSLYKLKRIHNHCCGSGIFILDSDFLSIPNIRYWIPDFGYRIPDSGSRIQKKTTMKEKGVYMGLGSVEDPDPGSGIGCFLTPGSGIWGWVKNQDPGSGINIPDPQHCLLCVI
jgi:hypothetical protein